LWFDADGFKMSGVGAVQFALLQNIPATIAANDFTIVA
jgi:hypothetical protein